MSAVLYSLTGPTCLHQNLVQTCSLSLHWCQPDEIHVFSYLFFDSVLFDQIKKTCSFAPKHQQGFIFY